MKGKHNCPAVLYSSLGFFEVLFMLPFSVLQKNCFPPLYPKLAFEIFIHTGNLESYSFTFGS